MAELAEQQVDNHLASAGLTEADYQAATQLLRQNAELAKLAREPLYLEAYARAFASELSPLSEPWLEPEAASAIPSIPIVPQDAVTLGEFLPRQEDVALSPESPLESGGGRNDTLDEETYSLPSLSQVLDRMLTRIWWHDAYKHLHHPKSSTRHSLNRFLGLGLLVAEGGRLSFPSQMLQAFVAADHLWELWQEENTTIIGRLVAAPQSFLGDNARMLPGTVP